MQNGDETRVSVPMYAFRLDGRGCHAFAGHTNSTLLKPAGAERQLSPDEYLKIQRMILDLIAKHQ